MPFTLIKSFTNLFIHSRERLKEKKKRKTKSIATLFEAEFFLEKPSAVRWSYPMQSLLHVCLYIIHFFISIFLLILLKTLLVLLFSLFECSGPYYKHKKIPIIKFP